MFNNVYLVFGCAFLLLMASCGASTKSQVDSSDTVAQQAIEPVQAKRTRNQITDAIRDRIIDHYRKEYGGGTTVMELVQTDTVIEVSFRDTTIDFQSVLFTAYIPLVKDISPVLSGDMDADALDDLLISVPTNGGGGGGNVYWSDHFLFCALPNGKYSLTDVKADAEIINGGGYFLPESITNQTIIGIANEYDYYDGRCCPSLYYRIWVKLIDGKLAAINKTAIEKPAELD